MIQLVTIISEDIFSYVNIELTKAVNGFLLEMPTVNTAYWFEKILNENFSLRKNTIDMNKRFIKLTLDYEAIDYAKTLAYIFAVDVILIYDWAYRILIEQRELVKSDFII